MISNLPAASEKYGFELSLQQHSDNQLSVRVAGSVTQRNLPDDSDPLVTALGQGVYQRDLVLDLSDVTSLDSGGVNWLLMCHKQTRARGTRLVLHSPSPTCNNVIRVLNLQTVFRIAEDDDQARRLLAAAPRQGESP